MKKEATLFDESPELDESKWESLVDESSRYKPGLLEGWKRTYQEWRQLYSKFRTIEQATMYAPNPEGFPPTPSGNTKRLHRLMIGMLSGHGEALMENLSDLHDKIEDKANAQHEYQECKMKLGILLESLRESLELWHPVNLGGRDAAAALFS